MMKSAAAKSPDAYVAALTGWRRALVEILRGAALAAGKIEETIKWGHIVYVSNGPVLLIRAELKRVLFGFWRGERLQTIDARLKPGGKYEMATLAFAEGDTISAAQAKRLVKAAVALNRELGDPTEIKSKGKRQVVRRGAERRKKDDGTAALREIALQLPDVEDASTDRGIAFKVRGRLLACSAIHASAEPGSLVVRVSPDERRRLMAEHPLALYLPNHYAKHAAVLARLSQLDRAALRDILGAAWLFVTEQAVRRTPSKSRRRR
jgi:hypothetical protein